MKTVQTRLISMSVPVRLGLIAWLWLLMLCGTAMAWPGKPMPESIRPIRHEPLALGWQIVIGFALTFVGWFLAVGLYQAVRRWHSSNLFDRKYRFPLVREVPLRLGAGKSGGCMATLTFEPPMDRPGVSSQIPEEKPLR